MTKSTGRKGKFLLAYLVRRQKLFFTEASLAYWPALCHIPTLELICKRNGLSHWLNSAVVYGTWVSWDPFREFIRLKSFPLIMLLFAFFTPFINGGMQMQEWWVTLPIVCHKSRHQNVLVVFASFTVRHSHKVCCHYYCCLARTAEVVLFI